MGLAASQFAHAAARMLPPAGSINARKGFFIDRSWISYSSRSNRYTSVLDGTL